jgi:hypothetical protein
MHDVDTTQKVQIWPKQGPIGHLHNICTWISCTTQRNEYFTEKAKQMVADDTAYIPPNGSITCWHGDLDAIECAFILGAPVDEFVFNAIREDQRKKKSKFQNTLADDRLDSELIVTDELSEDDWEDLDVIYDILSPFKM